MVQLYNRRVQDASVSPASALVALLARVLVIFETGVDVALVEDVTGEPLKLVGCISKSHRLNRCLGLCDEPFKARNRFQGGATLASSNRERMLQLAGVILGACMRVNVLVEPMHRERFGRDDAELA